MGSRRRRSEGPSWRGRIKGVEGLQPMCEVDGGCVVSVVRNFTGQNSFLTAVFLAQNGTRLSARAISRGPKTLDIQRQPPPPTSSHNVSARIKTIMHGAV